MRLSPSLNPTLVLSKHWVPNYPNSRFSVHTLFRVRINICFNVDLGGNRNFAIPRVCARRSAAARGGARRRAAARGGARRCAAVRIGASRRWATGVGRWGGPLRWAAGVRRWGEPTQRTTHNTQHTTHNTQHTTHSTQHESNTQHVMRGGMSAIPGAAARSRAPRPAAAGSDAQRRGAAVGTLGWPARVTCCV